MSGASKKSWHFYAPRWLSEWRAKLSLEREIAAIHDSYRPELQEATGDDEQRILAGLFAELDIPEMQLGELLSSQLIRRTSRRGLDIPNEDGWWEEKLGRKYLSRAGRARVKRMIRDDFRHDAKWWIEVLTLFVTVLTGLAGTIIGLLSLLRQSN